MLGLALAVLHAPWPVLERGRDIAAMAQQLQSLAVRELEHCMEQAERT